VSSWKIPVDGESENFKKFVRLVEVMSREDQKILARVIVEHFEETAAHKVGEHWEEVGRTLYNEKMAPFDFALRWRRAREALGKSPLERWRSPPGSAYMTRCCPNLATATFLS
jgi:hypothetical protein